MKKREELFALYIIDKKCTIRQCASNFDISKSTVHNDISKKLKHSNRFLYQMVYEVLNENFRTRHIRGGLSTKLKYAKLTKTKQKTLN